MNTGLVLYLNAKTVSDHQMISGLKGIWIPDLKSKLFKWPFKYRARVKWSNQSRYACHSFIRHKKVCYSDDISIQASGILIPIVWKNCFWWVRVGLVSKDGLVLSHKIKLQWRSENQTKQNKVGCQMVQYLNDIWMPDSPTVFKW